MIEELEAPKKNKLWVLTILPRKVEWYKAKLVVGGYSQTYGNDYDETFAPVANMNTVRILVSYVANIW